MSDPTEAFIDWDHSNATVLFYCTCGAAGKLETQCGNHVQCVRCKNVYRFGGVVSCNRVFVDPSDVRTHADSEEWELPPTSATDLIMTTQRPETQPDCFCCSCIRHEHTEDIVRADPYCRNHGWAGTRPCTEHGSPGMKDQTNRMPRSVQDARTSHRTSV